MAEQIVLKDHTLERRLFLSRLYVGGFVVILLIGVLIARLSFLQVSEYEYYSTKSDNYRIHIQSVVPTRGLIYDRNGVLLAENRTTSSLILVKENAGDIDASIEVLRELVELSDDDVEKFQRGLQRRRVPYSSVTLRHDLTENEIARLAVNQFRLPGISVEAQLIRHYPEGDTIAHALGYLGSISEEELQTYDPVNYRGTDQAGKMGVEKFYENILHGQSGYETVERNARGQIMKVLDRTDPVPGEDIVLNLDIELQQAVLAALDGHRGGAIALDVEDGGVLAMVSTPAFDPNLFVEGISQTDYNRLINDSVGTPLFNRALAKYSPGSTVKPFVGLASLDSGVRTREYTVYDPGYYQLEGDSHVFHDWTWRVSKNGHGSVNMERAIYQSCNIYFYDLAADLGIDPMHDFMYQFGFGRNTSIDIPQASSGVLPSKQWLRETTGQPWYPGYTLNSAIGQGYTEVTALQMATATLVMANQGRWAQPAMLRQIGMEGEIIERESYLADVQLNNEDDWNFMAGAMEKVVHRLGEYRDSGGAYPYIAMNERMAYHMAGKSGTAQVVNNTASSYETDVEVPEQNLPHAWFIAFAPVEDPKIAIAVFIEHGEAGSRVAGPIAREIIDAYLLEDGELKSQFLPDSDAESEISTEMDVAADQIELVSIDN